MCQHQESSAKQIIFISYSSKDKKEVEKLLPQLHALERSHNLCIWRDRDNIHKGDNWEQELNQAMEKAVIALLFVSTNYLNADFVFDRELPCFFHRQSCKTIRIWPIFLSPCASELSLVEYSDREGKQQSRAIDSIQCFSKERPLKELSVAERDGIMADIARDIVKTVKDIQNQPASPRQSSPNPLPIRTRSRMPPCP
jgi:hypothetical protein